MGFFDDEDDSHLSDEEKAAIGWAWLFKMVVGAVVVVFLIVLAIKGWPS